MTKDEGLADVTRRDKLANKVLAKRQKKLDAYLNSPERKRLEKAVTEAIDAINVLVEEWNDIILEDNPYFKKPKERA